MNHINLIKHVMIVISVVTAYAFQGCEKRILEKVEDVIDSSAVTTEVNVLDFDTIASSDHDMIQLAIDYAFDNGIHTVFVPAGTYQIDAAGVNGSKGISLKDSIILKLHDDAVLKAIPNSAGTYSVIRAWGVVDAKITGGAIIGDRNEHTGTTGEWGMGIDIRDAENIEVKDVLIKYCWGDGIYVGGTIPSRDILIENVTCDSNRRQGISVVHAEGLVLKNSVMSNTIGVAPQSGIDLEPNSGQTVRNVTITGSSFNKNSGKGITLFAAHGEVADIRIENCLVDSNYQVGVQLSGGSDTLMGRKVRRISMSNVTISNTFEYGIYIPTAENINIDSTRIINSGRRAVWVVNSRNIAIDSIGISNVFNSGFWITGSDSITVSRGYINIGPANVAAVGAVLETSRDLVFSNITMKEGIRGVLSTDVDGVQLNDIRFEDHISNGVRFNRTANGVVNNCYFEDISRTPYFIHASTGNHFTNNVLIGNCYEIDNTYPVLHLSGTSSANVIADNTISQGSYSNKANYGIWLMSTTYSNTVSPTNTIANDSYVVADIFDEGSSNSIN